MFMIVSLWTQKQSICYDAEFKTHPGDFKGHKYRSVKDVVEKVRPLFVIKLNQKNYDNNTLEQITIHQNGW